MFLLNLLYLLSLWNRWWFRMGCDWCVRILACTFAIKAHGFEPSQKSSLTAGLSTCIKLREHAAYSLHTMVPFPSFLPSASSTLWRNLNWYFAKVSMTSRACFIFQDGSNLQADILNTSAVEKYDHRRL